MELGKISKDNLSEVKLNGFKTEKRGTLGNIERENVKTRRRENVFSGREDRRIEEVDGEVFYFYKLKGRFE
ncbi:hypothetical protein NC653_021213 [Populus alba x Populus x berolinensis]|uniref:Uncharacterized protein n=1 Tax=Populus alba x Populus x berolinensis TaxID=444605 RepID=A0AAD6QDK0_9ROSI|nr:hypothetical protein NC653_021213 [Populus alba x Populus x berolinensis]